MALALAAVGDWATWAGTAAVRGGSEFAACGHRRNATAQTSAVSPAHAIRSLRRNGIAIMSPLDAGWIAGVPQGISGYCMVRRSGSGGRGGLIQQQAVQA